MKLHLFSITVLLSLLTIGLMTAAPASADRFDYVEHFSGLNNSSLAAAPDGSLFTVTSPQTLSHIAANGTVIDTFAVDAGLNEPMGITEVAVNSNTEVFVTLLGQNGSTNCVVRKFAATGALLASYDDCGGYRLDASANFVAVSSAFQGGVRILDSNLNYLRTCAVPGTPGAVTLDEIDGSFFVASSDGQIYKYSSTCAQLSVFSSPNTEYLSLQGASLWSLTSDPFDFVDVVHERNMFGEVRSFSYYRTALTTTNSVGGVQGFTTTPQGDLFFSAFSTGLPGGDPALVHMGNVAAPTVLITDQSPNPNSAGTAFINYTTESLHGIYDTCTVSYDGIVVDNCTIGNGARTVSAGAAGTHTFTVDICVNHTISEYGVLPPPDCASDSYTFVQQGPTVTIDDASKPSDPTSSTAASFTWTTTGAINSTQCKSLDGPFGDTAFHPCSEPYNLSNLAPGPHSFAVRVTGPSGTDTDSYTWVIGAAPPPPPPPPPAAPTVTIIGQPSDPTAQPDAYFYFQSTDADIWECKLDAGPYQACASPSFQSYAGLANGTHLFEVRVTNQTSGLMASDSYQWTIQEDPIGVTITANPGTTTGSSVYFGWQNTGPVFSNDCKMDNGPYQPCFFGQNYFGLSAGPHTFTVRANGANGSTATDSHDFTVVLPSINITASPDSTTTSTSAHFEWQNIRFNPGFGNECQLDGGPFEACSMPAGKDYADLSIGAHEFVVRGFDFSTFSNLQDSYSWTVEAATPPPPPPPTPVCADARIQSITPNPVAEGESIQLRGIYLDKTIGVTLNGKGLETQSKTASSIMAVIPKGAVSGLVKLVCADGEQDDGTPITVTQPNLPPVPNAVAKAKSKLSRTFAVDASLSFDPDKDGKIVAYKWSYKGKTLSRKVVFNYRVPSSVKSRTLLLTVVDDQGASASARVKLVPRVAQPTVVTLPGGNFGFDKFRLSKRGKATLVKARKYARGSHALLIETGASSEGSISYNRRLTQRRARSVKKVLLQGISKKSRPRKVTLRALGETHPVASNRTSRGRYLNRFARLTIYP